MLIGDEKKIRALMEEHQLSTEGVRFHQADEPEKAVTLATRLVLEGEVDYLMKGGLETRTMMKAFIARENGMRTGPAHVSGGLCGKPLLPQAARPHRFRS